MVHTIFKIMHCSLVHAGLGAVGWGSQWKYNNWQIVHCFLTHDGWELLVGAPSVMHTIQKSGIALLHMLGC